MRANRLMVGVRLRGNSAVQYKDAFPAYHSDCRLFSRADFISLTLRAAAVPGYVSLIRRGCGQLNCRKAA